MAENEVQGEWTLPEGWVWTTIGEACAVNPHVTRPDGFEDDTLISFVPMAAVDEVNGVIASPEIRPIGEVWRGYKRFSEGDVIFAKITPCMENGKAAIAKGLVNGIGLGSTEFHVLRPPDGILPQWIYHFVRQESFRGDAAARMTGTAGQLRVPATFVQEAAVPLAPLPEQRRIVAAIETQFTRLDAGVAALERARANLKRYRATVLKAACEGRLVPTEAALARAEGRAYEPADQLLARILAQSHARWEAAHPGKRYVEPAPPDTGNLLELPEGWCWATVEQLASLEPRSIQSGPFGSSLHHSEFQDSGVLAIGIDNVLDGQFSMGKQHRISPEKFEQLGKYKARPLDVLITVMATVGRCCVVPANLETAIITKHVYRISVNQELVIPFYLMFALLGGQEVRRQVLGETRGQTRPGINGTILKQIAIPIPPFAEQHCIVAEVERRLSVVAALEREVEAALARAARLRQSILKRAFEGRLVPQDPDDEPASALLERIRAAREAPATGGKKTRTRQNRLPMM